MIIGGNDRNRTGVQGFADLCLTTRPRRHLGFKIFIFQTTKNYKGF